MAAVNRAQYALTNYPRAPAIERALTVLVKAYDDMGLDDLRDDANRTLAANFPATQVKIGEREKWWRFW